MPGLVLSFLLALLCTGMCSAARLPDSVVTLMSSSTEHAHRKLLMPACSDWGCLAECSSCTMFPDGVKDSNHPEAEGVCTLLRQVYACTMPASSNEATGGSVQAAKSQEGKRRTVNGVRMPNSTGTSSSGSGSTFVDKHGFTVVNNGEVLWTISYS